MYRLAKKLSGKNYVFVKDDQFDLITGCSDYNPLEIKKIVNQHVLDSNAFIDSTDYYTDGVYQTTSWYIKSDDQSYVVKIIKSSSQFCNVFVIGTY